MKKVITTEKIPIKMWLEDVEEGALQQAKNIANLPFAFKHIALMPDAHQGYGMPIGGILATKNAIVPNAVGVDIGCGMCATKTNLQEVNRKDLQCIVDLIKKRIPVGSKHHDSPQDSGLLPEVKDNMYVCNIEYEAGLYQLGTLGGGNHFIEIQSDEEGYVWIMVHSGSRNIGKKVADHHNKIAVKLNETYFSEIKKEKQLAFLPADSEAFRDYFDEMNFCVAFAYANRYLMMEKIKNVFYEVLNSVPLDFGNLINIAHNYARRENHFNHNVIVHRKGATSAKEGEIGIIPGSQGAHSYIVIGLGNKESFESCSHGAGRIMGRRQAQRELSLPEEIKKMNDSNIIHGISSVKDLDEAASAYKNIDEVMVNQSDLVRIKTKLQPIAVIKG